MTATTRLPWIRALLLGLLGWSLSAVPIHSQTPAIEFIPHSTLPFRPRQPGVPNNTGGGTRGNCPKDPKTDLPLTPLIPHADEGIRGGMTTRENPEFWVYIPITEVEIGELLVLTEQTEEEIYHGKIHLPSTPGIIKIQLPAEPESRLKTGQRYLWQFSLICDPRDRGQDRSARGWIERIAPEAKRSLNPLQQASHFARFGVWYDLLTVLTHLRQEQPQDNDLARLWQILLQSDTVQLSAMSGVDILDCCEISPDL